MNGYINHSGGANGADLYWEEISRKYNIPTIAYSFDTHKTLAWHQRMLTRSELDEAYDKIKSTASILEKKVPRPGSYTYNLLARNYHIVKNAESIYAVATIEINDVVAGGTGWAVEMAMLLDKPVYVFDQEKNRWYFNDNKPWFEQYTKIPVLTKNFAGIGTRKLNDLGRNAIRQVLKYNNNIDDIRSYVDESNNN